MATGAAAVAAAEVVAEAGIPGEVISSLLGLQS